MWLLKPFIRYFYLKIDTFFFFFFVGKVILCIFAAY